ncbi:MAG: zinc-ribbon domain-containing protein [Deltaproteobacteria bacterium]|nr:zinc-ribbon domain-containing protein [Deltaproteobacteria bacterium]
MIIRCPNCSTTYKVDGSVLDAPKPSFRCSRCKHVFTVHVRLQLDEEASDAAPEAASGAPDPSGDTAEGDLEADASAVVQPEELGDEPGAADDDVLEAAGVEDLEYEAEAAPAVDPPAQPPEQDAREFDTDDTASRNPELPYPEFDPDPAEDPLLDEPLLHTLEREGDSEATDAEPDRPRPDFEIDDDFLMPPERATPPPPLSNTKGSVVPFVSLIGLILFAAGLVTLIHMINPQPLDSLVRRIPWYGAAVFDNKHYQSTLIFESLVSGVRPVLNQTEVFVVSGKLVNRNDQSIRQVQIEAQLFDAEGKQVGRQVTFVGNAISAKIIEDMSLREISLLQSLKPQSAYHIPPNGSADFTIVFPKPEAAVASFSCRVLAADGGAA